MMLAATTLFLILAPPALPLEFEADPPPASALQRTLAEYLREESKKTLNDCLETLQTVRNYMSTGLVGKEMYHSYKWWIFSSTDLETAFAAPIANLNRDIRAMDDDYAAWTRRELDLNRFYANCYDRTASGIRAVWAAYLAEAQSFIHYWRATVTRLDQACNERMQQATSDVARRQAEEINDRQQRDLFEQICSRYNQLYDTLSRRREVWCKQAWSWRDLAFDHIATRSDAHAYAFSNFGKLIIDQFSLGVRAYSAFEHFAYVPGSGDRLITGYSNKPWATSRRYPNIQSADSPGVLRMTGAASTSVDDYRLRQPQLGVTWERGSDIPSRVYDLRGGGLSKQEVALPRKYRPKSKAAILLIPNGPITQGDNPFRVNSVTVRNLVDERQQAIRYGSTSVQATLDDRGIAPVELDLDPMMNQMGARINQNALRATVDASLAGRTVTADSKSALYVMKHQVIIFVPGVFGSEIYTRVGGSDVMAYPRFSRDVVGEQPFLRLRLNENGEPFPDTVATQVDVFRKFTIAGASVATIYDVEDQPAVVRPQDTPTLLINGAEMKPYVLLPWPYDWRLRLERNVARLLDRGGTGNARMLPPYATGPSIREALEFYKERHPLLDDRVTIGGHSTGGVIIRRLIMTPGIENLVDKAYFINTPFFGAPKAYHVFMTGDMGIPFIANKFMVDIAPNAPIVYYLAPTEQYPNPVAISQNGQPIRRTQGQSVAEFMNAFVQVGRGNGIYPSSGAWSASLESAARSYHAGATGEPRIGWANCTVIWSSSGTNTPGPLRYDAQRKAFVFEAINGDGTVPIESQYGDFPSYTRVRNPGSIEHVPSPNQEMVWRTVIQKVTAVAN